MSDCYKTLGNYVFNVNDLIGSGAYGQVYKGCFISDAETHYSKDIVLAIKEIPILLNQADAEKFKKTTFAEISVMKLLNHPNIVKFIDVKRTENYFYIITEYCNQGSLSSYIKKNQITEMELLFYAKQLMEAFKKLYENNLMHRDVKPDNILLHNDVVKLADFGFARTIKQSASKEDVYDLTIVGTPYFMAPELLEGKNYGPKSDIYSLGLTLYYCLFQTHFWISDDFKKIPNVAMLFNRIKEISNKPLKIHFPISKEFEALLTGMLQFDVNKRYNWEQVFQHDVWKIDTKPIYIEKSKNYLSSVELKNACYFDINIIQESQGNLANVISRFSHERNFCLLAFNAIRKIQYYINEIEPHLFMRINFILCKKIALNYDILQKVFETKENLLSINNDDWTVYKIFFDLNEENKINTKNYQEFLEIKNLIKNEYEIAKESLVNFFNKCNDYVLRNIDIFNEKFKDFSFILNLNLEKCEKFDKVFNDVLKEILLHCKDRIFGLDLNNCKIFKNFIYLIDEIWILENPKFLEVGMNKFYDLKNFYEERREIETKDVLARIKEAYAFYKI